MREAYTFLVVDDHAESRFLLVKTLQRKYPGAQIFEASSEQQALGIARRADLSAIVTHRTVDVPGIELVREFRDVNPRVPIIMVSGIDREEAALAAGANLFLHYDQWLRIGTLVESLLNPASPRPSERDLARPSAGGTA
jgi:CheY-like chemotaxis protein